MSERCGLAYRRRITIGLPILTIPKFRGCCRPTTIPMQGPGEIKGGSWGARGIALRAWGPVGPHCRGSHDACPARFVSCPGESGWLVGSRGNYGLWDLGEDPLGSVDSWGHIGLRDRAGGSWGSRRVTMVEFYARELAVMLGRRSLRARPVGFTYAALRM